MGNCVFCPCPHRYRRRQYADVGIQTTRTPPLFNTWEAEQQHYRKLIDKNPELRGATREELLDFDAAHFDGRRGLHGYSFAELEEIDEIYWSTYHYPVGDED